MKAWALLSNQDDDRTWESNEGYPDVLGSQYAYDSGVAYHLQVAEGDVVVLRNSQVVHGISRVDRIDSEPGVKTRRVCPKCGKTGYTKRTTIRPTFLCRQKGCRHEFEVPVERKVPVTLYVASYGSQWEPLDGALSYADIAPALDKAQQNAIRTCDLDQLEQLLAGVSAVVPPVPAMRSTPPKGGHRTALVRVRNGQAAFREQLLQMYGLICAVTGPCPAPALQAAHLREFAKHETHDPADGLLLRSDIHQLFDAGLLAVDTTTMKVVIAPSIARYPNYKALQGISVQHGVYVPALTDHYKEVTAAW